jgi:anti-sigma factor RsiW
MATGIRRHINEATIEKYSLDTLSEKPRARVEEHLLICESCRQAVTASDAYVKAMRRAAASVRQTERRPKGRVSRKAGGPV